MSHVLYLKINVGYWLLDVVGGRVGLHGYAMSIMTRAKNAYFLSSMRRIKFFKRLYVVNFV